MLHHMLSTDARTSEELQEVAAAIHNNEFIRPLSEEARMNLFKAATLRHCVAGEVVCLQSEEANEFYIILDGIGKAHTI